MLKKSCLCFLTAITLLTVTPYTYSQTEFWQRSNGPSGGFINHIAEAGDGTFYVAAVFDFYHSENNGETWQLVNGAIPNGLLRAVFVKANGDILLGTNHGIFLSSDDGQNWQAVNTGLLNTEIRFFATDSDGNILSGTDNGLYRSTDGGMAWSRFDFGIPAQIRVNGSVATATGSLFAITQGLGVLRSEDQGSTWKQVNNGLINLIVSEIAVNQNGALFAASGTSVFRSENNGDTWSRIDSGLPGTTVLELAVDSENHLFSTHQNNGMYRSDDNGDSWFKFENELADENVSQILFTSQGFQLALATFEGIFKSDDGATTWQKSSDGLNATNTLSLFQTNANEILAGTELTGLFRTTDNGETWDKIETGELFITQMSDLDVNTQGTLFIASNHDGFFASQDDGSTWQLKNDGLPTLFIADVEVNASDRLFVGTQEGVFISDNGGDSWAPSLENIIVRALIMTATGDIFAGEFAHVHRSSDNGQSWQPFGTGLPAAFVQTLAINSRGRLFAGLSTNGVYKSEDNGETWSVANTGLTDQGLIVNSIVALSDDQLYVATNMGVFSSLDDGQSWGPVSDGLPNSTINTIIANTRGELFVGTFARSVYKSRASVTSVSTEPPSTPLSFQLLQNYPNPFNPETVIRFSLQESGPVSLKVYNLRGEEVADLVSQTMPAGDHAITWQPTDLSSGSYFYQLQQGDSKQSKKLILLK